MIVSMPQETSVESVPLVPARILNEFVYCPRLAYIEWVQGEFEESADTLDGTLRHRRVDREVGALPSPISDEAAPAQDAPIHAKSIMLSSERHGLIARIDLVESADSEAVPVDYKRGKVPDLPCKAWEADRIQLCAQGLILRDNGYTCSKGVIYYSSSKTRIDVMLDASLEEKTLDALRQLRTMADCGTIPPPLVHNQKCVGCSLAGICLPDEVNLLAADHDSDMQVRRLVPGLSDMQPVYVQEQGAMVSKKGDVLQIKREGVVVQEARLLSVSQLSVFGNAQVSTQLLRELGDRGIPVCYFTYGGWFAGIYSGMGHKNVDLRRQQFALAADDVWCVRQAGEFVSGKIKNARTLLRRNSSDPGKGVLAELSRLASQAQKAASMESLLGLEGAAARTYFSRFSTMLKPKAGAEFDFRTRNRRPPTDQVNALLSFVYSLLIKDAHLALLSVGFDPLMGFLHRPRYGKPALALDLAEEFRPLIGDSVVLTVINGGEVAPQDFVIRGGACALTSTGRRSVIGAYERRLATEVKHPLFGYSVSYRRIMEVQARLLARRVAGEIPKYVPFATR